VIHSHLICIYGEVHEWYHANKQETFAVVPRASHLPWTRALAEPGAGSRPLSGRGAPDLLPLEPHAVEELDALLRKGRLLPLDVLLVVGALVAGAFRNVRVRKQRPETGHAVERRLQPLTYLTQ
jgi:hypothetical protein